MANVLSKENMTKLANELKDEPGYKLKDRLLNSLMGIMKEYEIPHGMALSYANAILFAIMGQLPVVAPDKYDRAYQAEWKAEQEECFKELAEKFERLRNELQIYQSRQLEILSADAIDLDIRRQTTDPKIGFDFFNVDDDTFKEALESKKNDEVIAIKARCKEEAIYCTINELWMQGENRPIFIVKNEEDWKSLLQIKDAGNIYIPWFYSDQIVTIPNNTNRLFDMAKFCPCEENGTVSYDEIKVWVDKLIRILDSNHQKEMFGYVLGRLFAYAPKTADGHYPCEAVCQIIEEYGDESLLSEYRCELFNKREIFSPSAGRAEKDIAEGYKDNAEFLSIKYPKTADVFFKMSQSYVYDSDLERRRAENGYF